MAADAEYDLSSAIFNALVNAQYAIDPMFRPHCRWRMNPDWLEVLKQLRDRSGNKLWEHGGMYLFGWPYEVVADGGAPHLVWDD